MIEGTADAEITDETVWQEYEFKGKPGAVGKLPRQWAPYHLRLDWMMWFAAISPTYGRQWFAGLLERLLRRYRDPEAAAAQPISRFVAQICPRAGVPLPLRHAPRTTARPRVVAPYPGRSVLPAGHPAGLARRFDTAGEHRGPVRDELVVGGVRLRGVKKTTRVACLPSSVDPTTAMRLASC